MSMDQPDLQFSSKTVMGTIGKLVVITEARLRMISRYLDDKRVLEYLHGYQSEVTECKALGDSDLAVDG